jgi:hypothetical protein
MKFISWQHINDGQTWAVNLGFLYICSVGIVINNIRMRTDVFFTACVLPFSCAVSVGMTHPD